MLNPLIDPNGASTLPGNNAVPGTNPLPVAGQTFVAGQTPGAVTPTSSRLKPEDILKDRYKAGQRTLQQEFQRGWDAINDQARNLGIPRVEHQRKLDDLHMQAQQKADSFNAGTQRAIDQLKELDRLAANGLIDNADEAKWNLTMEPKIRKAMFPEEQSAMKQFSDLDIYRGKLEGLLGGKGYFREIQPKKPGAISRVGRFLAHNIPNYITPGTGLTFGVDKPVSEKTTLEIWDPSIGKKGDYRPAKSEEQNIGDEIRRVRELQNVLLGQPTSPMMKTALTSKRMGGSIAEQTKNYLQQKETGTQRQESEKIEGGQRIRVISPQGATGTVETGELEQYLAQGFKRVQ